MFITGHVRPFHRMLFRNRFFLTLSTCKMSAVTRQATPEIPPFFPFCSSLQDAHLYGTVVATIDDRVINRQY